MLHRPLSAISLAIALLFFLSCLGAKAQEELGGSGGAAKSWTMLSLHRIWTPQANNAPNGGFGVNAFFSVDNERRTWAGMSILGTGLVKRDALAINGGMGWWFLGDSRLGAFAFAMTGLGITSANGLTGFDFFSDPTSTYGLASQAGLGGAVEVFTNIKIHVNAYGLWFTNDGGPTPFGIQAGLTFGGR